MGRAQGKGPSATATSAMSRTRAASTAAEAKPTVVVIRDPDSSNDFSADESIAIIDVDLGSEFDGLKYAVRDLGEDDARRWATQRMEEVAHLDPDDDIRERVEELAGEIFEELGEMPPTQLKPADDADPSAPTMLVVRDPDYENEFHTNADINIVDIDLGGSFDGTDDIVKSMGKDDAISWCEDYEAEAAKLPEGSEARKAIESVVAEARAVIDDADDE